MPMCVPRLSPPLAGCPHPSRYGAKALCRATFPKGKAKAALESQTPKREAGRLSPQSTELQRCEAQLSPPGRAALIRHGAAQKRSTAPPSPRGRLSAALALRRSRNNPSVFLPERAKKQLPLHRGAEKALRGLFCLRIKITSARLHRLWRGSESSLQRRQRIFHP